MLPYSQEFYSLISEKFPLSNRKKEGPVNFTSPKTPASLGD